MSTADEKEASLRGHTYAFVKRRDAHELTSKAMAIESIVDSVSERLLGRLILWTPS